MPEGFAHHTKETFLFLTQGIYLDIELLYDSSLEIYWSRKCFDLVGRSRLGNWSSFWIFDPKLEP
jgi:hypothetical protein